MGLVVDGDLPTTLVQTIFALFLHLAWVGLLGVLFAFLISVGVSISAAVFIRKGNPVYQGLSPAPQNSI